MAPQVRGASGLRGGGRLGDLRLPWEPQLGLRGKRANHKMEPRHSSERQSAPPPTPHCCGLLRLGPHEDHDLYVTLTLDDGEQETYGVGYQGFTRLCFPTGDARQVCQGRAAWAGRSVKLRSALASQVVGRVNPLGHALLDRIPQHTSRQVERPVQLQSVVKRFDLLVLIRAGELLVVTCRSAIVQVQHGGGSATGACGDGRPCAFAG